MYIHYNSFGHAIFPASFFKSRRGVALENFFGGSGFLVDRKGTKILLFAVDPDSKMPSIGCFAVCRSMHSHACHPIMNA